LRHAKISPPSHGRCQRGDPAGAGGGFCSTAAWRVPINEIDSPRGSVRRHGSIRSAPTIRSDLLAPCCTADEFACGRFRRHAGRHRAGTLIGAISGSPAAASRRADVITDLSWRCATAAVVAGDLSVPGFLKAGRPEGGVFILIVL